MPPLYGTLTPDLPLASTYFADDGQLGHPQVTNRLNGLLGLSE